MPNISYSLICFEKWLPNCWFIMLNIFQHRGLYATVWYSKAHINLEITLFCVYLLNNVIKIVCHRIMKWTFNIQGFSLHILGCSCAGSITYSISLFDCDIYSCALLPHKVKTQYLHVRSYAEYFLLYWKIPEVISRRPIFFHN